MANIQITTPANMDQRIIDAFALFNNWQSTLADGSPNPISKAQNVKLALIQHIKDVVATIESQVAAKVAAQAAIDSASTLAIT